VVAVVVVGGVEEVEEGIFGMLDPRRRKKNQSLTWKREAPDDNPAVTAAAAEEQVEVECRGGKVQPTRTFCSVLVVIDLTHLTCSRPVWVSLFRCLPPPLLTRLSLVDPGRVSLLNN
jgi:hypothetical protein